MRCSPEPLLYFEHRLNKVTAARKEDSSDFGLEEAEGLKNFVELKKFRCLLSNEPFSTGPKEIQKIKLYGNGEAVMIVLQVPPTLREALSGAWVTRCMLQALRP